jgi:hypothetical protein
MATLSKAEEYVIPTRRIAGSQAEKMEQIDEAIQELQDLKLLECAADRPNVRFLAVPRRTAWFGMTITLLVMLALLTLLLGVRLAATQALSLGPDVTHTTNQSFFPVHGGGTRAHQNTALVGLVWWIGNKTGSW